MIKKYFAGLLLFLFLFPQVQKGLHDFSHRNDHHCNATAEQHLHPFEHVCSLCDFSIPVSTEFFTFEFHHFTKIGNVVYSRPFCLEVPANFWSLLPPRAPPEFLS